MAQVLNCLICPVFLQNMAAVLPVQSFAQQQFVYSMAPTHSTEQHVVYSVAPSYPSAAPVHYAQPQVYHSVPATRVSQGEAALIPESKPENEELAQNAQDTNDCGVESTQDAAPVHAEAVVHSAEQQPMVYSVAPTYSMAAPVHYATYAQPHVYQSAPVTYVTHHVSPTVVQQNVAALESKPESDEPKHEAEPNQEGEESKHDAEEPKQEDDIVQENAPVVPVYAAPAVYTTPAVYAASPTLLTSHATMPLKIGETVDGGVNPLWSARYVYNGVEYTTFDAYHSGVKTHVEGTAAEQEATPVENAPVAEAEKTVRAVKPVKKGCC